MLVIPAVIKKSRIGGKGLFTKRNIKRGEIIVQIGQKERHYSEEDVRRFSLRYQRILSKFSYWDRVKKEIVYPLDGTKYLNHSCEPNVLNTGNRDLAKREIQAGEELTYDYRPILSKEECFACNCGTKKCCRFIRPNY